MKQLYKAVSNCTNGWAEGQIVQPDDPFFKEQDVATCLKRNLIVPLEGVESVQAKADAEKAELEKEVAALLKELAAVRKSLDSKSTEHAAELSHAEYKADEAAKEIAALKAKLVEASKPVEPVKVEEPVKKEEPKQEPKGKK